MRELWKVLLGDGDPKPLRATLAAFTFAIGTASGVAQLFLAGTYWRTALLWILFGSLALLLFLLLRAALIQQARAQIAALEATVVDLGSRLVAADETKTTLERDLDETKVKLTRAQQKLNRVESSIEHIAESQEHLFRESVVIEIIVGEASSGDRVRQVHRTIPGQNGDGRLSSLVLPFRTLRPITSNSRTANQNSDDMDLRGQFEEVRHGSVGAFVLNEDQFPVRAYIDFRPPMRSEQGWVLEYRTPGLWDPLRRDGIDSLGWRTTSPNSNHCPFTRVEVRFVFPKGASGCTANEVSGLGQTESQFSDDGEHVEHWILATPEARRYRWDVAMNWAPPAVTP